MRVQDSDIHFGHSWLGSIPSAAPSIRSYWGPPDPERWVHNLVLANQGARISSRNIHGFPDDHSRRNEGSGFLMRKVTRSRINVHGISSSISIVDSVIKSLLTLQILTTPNVKSIRREIAIRQ